MATADSASTYIPVSGELADDRPPQGTLLRNPVPVAIVGIGLAALSLGAYSVTAKGAIAAFIAVVLVVVAATDLERRIIPNRIIVPATAAVLVARLALLPHDAGEFVIAALAAGFAFLVLNVMTRNGVGMGDVKLVAFLGAGLGTGVIGAIAVGCFSIFPFALGTLVRGGMAARKSTLPFGPFLAFGALVILIVPRLIGVGGV
jgi:prepilin signal peptidase PulO-like enzyme (type II secretory pathway)